MYKWFIFKQCNTSVHISTLVNVYILYCGHFIQATHNDIKQIMSSGKNPNKNTKNTGFTFNVFLVEKKQTFEYYFD